jgi:ATP-dependent Clp protease adapter protein ClpS
MRDVQADAAYLHLVLHDDEKTPENFMIDLLRSVFSLPAPAARALCATIQREGQAVCGIYPRAVAEVLLQTARKRIKASGNSLSITTEADDDLDHHDCKLCGVHVAENGIDVANKMVFVCDDCTLAVAGHAADVSEIKRFTHADEALDWHFAGIATDALVTTSRQFPGHMRADVQTAIDRLFSESAVRFFAIHEQRRYETLTISALTRYADEYAYAIAPAQYHDVDTGEIEPVKCLNNGLWLCVADDLRYAVMLSAHRDYGHEAETRIEIAVPSGAAGSELVQRCFSELESAVNAARCYRGKMLSLDASTDYRGRSKGVTVHRLPPVRREEVILPEATLKLLDRNVLSFVGTRPELRRLGQSTRKGILLYGPPGTGKTHTIRYLASNLPGHTTLIITAAQVALLAHYMALARLLQPAMVVIEDVDLIAHDRDEMGPCEESMLNELLNEMDGLKEDADILFVLTTNRPEQLEGALSGRPGRVDQAIEVPVPDDIGRGKLIQLYGKGLPLGEAVVREATRRTKGVSAAFIKELMRRVAQASIARDGGMAVESRDIGEALDDMLFTGGKLNVKLLGGALELADA